VNWWKDRHNTHHASTNILGGDPDIDNLPLFIWDEKDLHRAKDYPLADVIIPYQHYYFLIFTPFLKIIWCLQSFFWLSDPTTQNHSYTKSKKAEFYTLYLHYFILFLFLYCVPWTAWIPFLMISEGIGGTGIALVVFMNHYACEKMLIDEGKEANFLNIQLETTKNLNPGIITDWICGGLNYQIEHHLFSTMPRHNLSKVKPIIEEFCKENKLPYMSEDFIVCLTKIEKTLATVASAYVKTKELNKPKNE